MNHHRLRERLAHYRTGGSSNVIAATAPEDSWPERVGHIRSLVQARRRRLQDKPASVSEVPTEIGTEIAPGVRLLTTTYNNDASSLPMPPAVLPGDKVHWDGAAPLLVFDTETTGLGSGAGQWVWMVGILMYAQSRWCLHQWWLSRPGSECLFLEAIAGALPAAGILLSYNGRSFDVPMLRTRHQLNGLVNPFIDRLHLDLLHVVRRRYRGQWADCRLATVERELLGRPRTDDLPGSMAPEAWRRYLRNGETGPVAQVLSHNRIDLESLVYLIRVLADSHSSECGVS